MTDQFNRAIRGEIDISLTEFTWLSLQAMETPVPPPARPVRDPLEVGIEKLLFARAQLRAHRAVMRGWNALGREERRQTLKNHREFMRAMNAHWIAENESTLARIEPLIRQVTDWDPPEEYLPLQEFMLFSLESGLRSALKRIDAEDNEDLDDDAVFEKRQARRRAFLLAQEAQLRKEIETRIAQIRSIRRYRTGLEAMMGSFEPSTISD